MTNNVLDFQSAAKARDLRQILQFCDAVEAIVRHEPDEAKRSNKLARVQRTRATTTEALGKLEGAV